MMKIRCCNVKTTPLTLQQPSLRRKNLEKKGKNHRLARSTKLTKKLTQNDINVVQDYYKITKKLVTEI